VIVDDLDVVGVPVLPAEADPPLIVDANAVLTGAVTLELLQSVARRDAEIVELLGRVYGDKLLRGRLTLLYRSRLDGIGARSLESRAGLESAASRSERDRRYVRLARPVAQIRTRRQFGAPRTE